MSTYLCERLCWNENLVVNTVLFIKNRWWLRFGLAGRQCNCIQYVRPKYGVSVRVSTVPQHVHHMQPIRGQCCRCLRPPDQIRNFS